MNDTLSPLAVEIFTAVKSSRPNAVFLCCGPENNVVAFGPCTTSQFRYRVVLESGRERIELSDSDQSPISILLNQKKDGAVQLALYAAERDPIEFDGTADIPRRLTGFIFIEAHEANGPGQAVIHAVFADTGEASLLIDASPQLLRHLDLTTRAWTIRGGGVDLVEIF